MTTGCSDVLYLSSKVGGRFSWFNNWFLDFFPCVRSFGILASIWTSQIASRDLSLRISSSETLLSSETRRFYKSECWWNGKHTAIWGLDEARRAWGYDTSPGWVGAPGICKLFCLYQLLSDEIFPPRHVSCKKIRSWTHQKHTIVIQQSVFEVVSAFSHGW